jgi:hypothetical protein
MTSGKLVISILGLAMPLALSGQTTPPPNSNSTPDFSGVYYPLSPFGRAGGGRAGGPPPGAPRQGPPPRPTASAPLSDG